MQKHQRAKKRVVFLRDGKNCCPKSTAIQDMGAPIAKAAHLV